MNTRIVVAALSGALVGLIGGFFIANSINRGEIETLKVKLEQANHLPPADGSVPDAFSLGDDEIKAKIAQADANPGNFDYQKNLGGALYRYASMKNDPGLADEARRILIRANSIEPKDYDVMVDLGNAYFDAGYLKKDSALFAKARDMYENALAVKPTASDVRTDLGISYIVDAPPDYNHAVEQFQKVLKAEPRHERALQFLTAALIELGNWNEAGKTLDQLKTVNPKNEKAAELASQISSKKAEPLK